MSHKPRSVRIGVIAVLSFVLLAHPFGCRQESTVTRVSRVPPPQDLTLEFAVPVLMYHRIDDLTKEEARSPLLRDLTVPPADFEAQVKYLKENGFTFLHVSEIEQALLNGTGLPERAVAITMDDGYKDNFDRAFPILKKYGAKATIFLVSRTVDTPRHLSWADVLAMRKHGAVSYGSHTVSHPDLTSLTLKDLDFQLIESKQVLEARIPGPITALAYPAGQYNQLVAARTEAAGYLSGWKKGGGPVEPKHDPYLLPRVRVHGRTSIREFERKVQSGQVVQRMRARERERVARRSGVTPGLSG